MADLRAQIRDGLADLMRVSESDLAATAEAVLAADVDGHAGHPVNDLPGRDAVIDGLVRPLRDAIPDIRRQDLLVIGGENRRDVGGTWVACITHYVGRFMAPLWGIPPSGRLVFLRAGEFYRVRGGRIDRFHIIPDLVDLMRQAGRMPLPRLLGTEMTFPPPATQDGICPVGHDGAASLDLVERMLGGLHSYDAVTYDSEDQTGTGGTWAPDFLWYGPGGIGSTTGWDGFVHHHRAAFLSAFPDRRGGNHYCRIGDGAYAAVSGWPSMTMTHQGEYLGVPATGRALTLRVMDFYRTAGGRIAENWVLLDYLDLFQQMGIDLIARSVKMTGP